MAIFSHMAPVPPGFKPKWRDYLEEHVALYRRMPEELTLCVEELVPWFIKKVTWKWEPWVGPKPDEEMAKVCVSFLACLLIVNRSKKDLEHFHTFVFHPASLKDDDGETWLGNPHDSGTTPINDHIKLASGPWTSAGYGALGQLTGSTIYETAVYYCYNKLAGIFCFTSFDGGATFEAGGQIIGLATTNGGLHGAISTAPDGTVYVTPRVETPSVIVSKDNGFTWFERTMGEDVGTPYPRKNSEISTDTESNAYHVWTGGDEGVYMSRSTDSGETWEQESIRISPVEVISSVFPQTDAGDPGRIAVTYLGSENSEMLNESNIDGNPWDGNAHFAPNNATYHLYITYSLNALDPEPVFHTYRVTDDPVQVGSICLNSGDCRDIGGSNRNLLDFNDLHIDRQGRVYVAFADGCTGDCATNNNSSAQDSRDGRGSVYYLAMGPSLIVEYGELSPLMAGVTEMRSDCSNEIQCATVERTDEED